MMIETTAIIREETLHCVNQHSNKSYTIRLLEKVLNGGAPSYEVETLYGPMTSPHSARGKNKFCGANEYSADSYVSELVRSKENKGYVLKRDMSINSRSASSMERAKQEAALAAAEADRIAMINQANYDRMIGELGESW